MVVIIVIIISMEVMEDNNQDGQWIQVRIVRGISIPHGLTRRMTIVIIITITSFHRLSPLHTTDRAAGHDRLGEHHQTTDGSVSSPALRTCR